MLLFSEQVDECATAAAIYQCGRQVAPKITKTMHNQVLANALMVTFLNLPDIATKYCSGNKITKTFLNGFLPFYGIFSSIIRFFYISKNLVIHTVVHELMFYFTWFYLRR